MTKLMFKSGLCASLFMGSAFLSLAQAASLQVSPVLIDIENERGGASTLTVKNSGDKPLQGQVRVFKWSQNGGKDSFEETNDVVASPPLMSLNALSSQVVRIVRVSKAKVAGEESYRLVIDELPPENVKKGTITMTVRHAIPVFFSHPEAKPPKLTWSLMRVNGKLSLKAVNEGEKRIRLANAIGKGAGGSIEFGRGLVGYVLGRSSMSFAAKSTNGSLSGEINLKAETHMEPVNVTLSLQ